MVANRTGDVAETGNCRDGATRLRYANLFAQTLRGISEDSEQRVARYQIECPVWEREVVGIALL